jgi:hypothetical protein
MSTSSCVSVLRIGVASTGTLDGVDPVDEVLQRALRTHFEASTTNDDAAAVTSGGHLIIKNRYFTARVAMQPLGSASEQLLNSTSKTTKDESIHQEDGVLLLFWEECKSTHSLSLLEELALIHDQAEHDQQNGDLLRLCVRAHFGNDSNYSSSSPSLLSPKQQEEEYARRILWCLDRGYEYIEADLSQEGLQQGHDVRDKDGFARIVEAISGTVWSSAVMKSNTKAQLQTSYQQATEQFAEQNHENDQETSDSFALPTPLTTAAATTTQSQLESLSSTSAKATTLALKELSTDDDAAKKLTYLPLSAYEVKEADEKARKLLLDNQIDESDSNAAAVGSSSADVGMPTTVPTSEDEEQELMMQNFELALREATRIRELSKTGSLTDDERRQRAGDTANLLMSMLDQMGFDDDDEDDDDDEPEIS